MIRSRLEPLTTLVLSECVEQAGRFIPAIEHTLGELALQPAWTLPAHDPDLRALEGLHSVDLNACETAHDVAWSLRLVGRQLSPEVRASVAAALESRIFAPVRNALRVRAAGGPLGPHWWIEGLSNWNAVCVSNVLGAAYALSRSDLAEWIDFARKASRYYLESLREDGYADEGPLYWNYGFGYYLRLRETLRWADPKGTDLLMDARAQAMAAFPRRAEVAAETAAPFGDAPFNLKIDPVKRAHAEVAIGWATTQSWQALSRPTSSGGRLNEAVWRLWGAPQPVAHPLPAPPAPGNCSLFPASGVAVLRAGVRSRGLAVSFRTGGSRSHAHDDAGSYVVAFDGVLIAGDPGAPTYTRDTFGPARRRHALVNSYGHPVPRVDGRLQLDGTAHRAAWMVVPCREERSDGVDASIDLMPVYDVPGLKQLSRTIDYDERQGLYLTVADRFGAERPVNFETALITRATARIVENGIEISSGAGWVRVDIHASAAYEIQLEPLIQNSPDGIVRVAVRLKQPAAGGCVVYRFRAGDGNQATTRPLSCPP